jgi:hypothetical protein
MNQVYIKLGMRKLIWAKARQRKGRAAVGAALTWQPWTLHRLQTLLRLVH